MMDGHYDIAAPSDAMRAAIECLGGRKTWRGGVRGLFGLLKRDFEITSEGVVENGILTFSEVMVFDDGEVEHRHWRIFDTADGVDLDSPDVKLLKHGQLQDDGLVFVYRVAFGIWSFRYRDVFKALPSGRIENTGRAKIFGVPILDITVEGASL
ncbi:MAG: DUF3833 family protein [Pseudomonadota bacterium]